MYAKLSQITFQFADGTTWVGSTADFQAVYCKASPNGSRNTHFPTLFDAFHATGQATAAEPDPNSQPVEGAPPTEAPENWSDGDTQEAERRQEQGGNPVGTVGDVPPAPSDVEDTMDAAASPS